MGQLISHFAMEKAIEKAKKTGVGFVSVRNSNHFGIAGYYAEMASKQGLLGMACTNSEAIMVPTFGRKAMLGSNPLLLQFPPVPLRQPEPDLLFSERSDHPEQVSLWKYSISSPHAKLLFYSL